MATQKILPLAAMEKVLKQSGADRVSEDAKGALKDALEDIANDIAILHQRKRLVSATILLRSLVDSLFDLFLVEKDINNIHYLRYRDLKTRIKDNQRFLDPRNPEYCDNQEQRSSFISKNKEFKDTLKDLKDRGYAYENLNKKFELMDMEHFHRAVYQTLNKEVHSSLDIIEKRHYYIGNDGRRKLQYLVNYSEEEYPIIVPLVVSYIFATNTIRKVLDIENSDPIYDMVNLANQHLEIEIDHSELH